MTARSHLIKAVIILASAISLPGYAKDLQASEVPQAVPQSSHSRCESNC